jgi:hypothetical protein
VIALVKTSKNEQIFFILTKPQWFGQNEVLNNLSAEAHYA